MGTKCVGAPQGSSQIPTVPPGFKSLTSFTLERVCDKGDAECAHEGHQSGVFDEDAFRKSLQEKPWLSVGVSDDNSEGSSDSEVSGHVVPTRKCLPKGVVHGSSCQNCQKVMARWHPHEACRPSLEEAPTFYPSEEDFKDTIKYVASIRPLAESYGICRIIPPSSWKPPCPLEDKSIWENLEFSTLVQPVDRLQNRFSVEDPKVTSRKRQRISSSQVEHSSSDDRDFRETSRPGYYFSKDFEFERGPKFTFKAFEKYANDFVEQYFCPYDTNSDSKNNQDCLKREWKPSVDNLEGEYWRIIEKPTEEIEVLYGANIETNKFSSGFPRTPSALGGCSVEDKYLNSGWNLNNTPHLPGSMLTFESGDIPGILMPLLHVGMCFSTILWHVEQHYLYSLNYLHWGAPRVCYGIPGRHAPQLEAAMKKHHSSLFAELPHLFLDQVTQFSPSFLKLEGVPVYRCVQQSGEFVLTFPRAYHCCFNCGFSCAEAVNVAPMDWLPHGQNAVEAYRDQKRIVSISHDKLLLGAAREAVRAQWNVSFRKKVTLDDLLWRDACGQDKILARAFKARIDLECKRRDYFCRYLNSRKMNSGLDASRDRRCVICHYDLHLSAAGCSCSPDKFACLNHAKQMCRCDQSMKFALFRYAISELNTLTDALGGKLSAVHKWAISDLGLSLSSRASKHTNKEQSLASEASSADSLLLGDDETCGNSQKKPPTDHPSGSHSLLPTREQILHKYVIDTSFENEVGVNLVPTPEKIVPQTISDRKCKDHMTVNDECKHSKADTDEEQSISKSAHGPPNTTNMQHGPRLAKVVPRINCTVELLQCGTVISTRSWSTSRAIFPKGYRSRVRYLNVKNPCEMCYYVSEILDAGLGGPLFMVQMEQCASEVFIHTSAAKCWDMVRERVNQEIRRQHSFGKFDVPRPQAPDSIDALKMFGLTSPTIAQAIKALDTNHVCTEYWKSRSESKDPSSAVTLSRESGAEESDTQQQKISNSTFHGLLKKANPEELEVLHQILTDDQPRLKQEATKLLKDEMGLRSKGMRGES